MKTKLVLSSMQKDFNQLTDLPFIPRVNEGINLNDILKKSEIKEIQKTARCWSGIRGIVKSIEYRHDENEFYVEINIWCED